MASSEYLGVALVLIGSVGNNLGNNLVSMGHRVEHVKETKPSSVLPATQNNDMSLTTDGTQSNIPGGNGPDEEEEEEEEEDPGCISWRTLGVIVFVLGNIINFGSFAFGSQAVVASLDSIQFVSNVAFAKFIHKEVITWRICIATTSIVVGNLMVVLFAELGVTLYDSSDMIELYKSNHIYHGYVAFAICLWAVTAYTYNYYYKMRMFHRKLLYRHSLVEPLCYAISSTIIGTQAVLNAKSMALLISVSGQTDRNEFEKFYIYLMLGTWLLLVAYWLRRLDLGLKLFPPVFIIPVMQVFFILFAIVCGGIYFREFEAYSPLQFAGFFIGVILILSGVYALAPPDMQLYVPEDEAAKCAADIERGLSLADEDVERPRDDGRLDSKTLEAKLSKHLKPHDLSPDGDNIDRPIGADAGPRLKPHGKGKLPKVSDKYAADTPIDTPGEDDSPADNPDESGMATDAQTEPSASGSPPGQVPNASSPPRRFPEEQEPQPQMPPIDPSKFDLPLNASNNVEPYSNPNSSRPYTPDRAPDNTSSPPSSAPNNKDPHRPRSDSNDPSAVGAPPGPLGIADDKTPNVQGAWGGAGDPPPTLPKKKSRKMVKRPSSKGSDDPAGAALPPVRPGSASGSRRLEPPADVAAAAGTERPSSR